MLKYNIINITTLILSLAATFVLYCILKRTRDDLNKGFLFLKIAVAFLVLFNLADLFVDYSSFISLIKSTLSTLIALFILISTLTLLKCFKKVNGEIKTRKINKISFK